MLFCERTRYFSARGHSTIDCRASIVQKYNRYIFVSVSTSCLTMLFLGLSENSGLLFDLIFTKNIPEVINIPFCYFLSSDSDYNHRPF